MYTLKLPYHPRVQATAVTTMSGIVEISHPDIYDVPIPDKVIIKVDCLRCLAPIVGDSCFIYRDYLYNVIAGKGDVYNQFGHLYRRHKKLCSYVNEVATYGNNTEPLVDLCLEPLRDKVKEYLLEVHKILSGTGGKHLVDTHGYVYFCYRPGVPIPDVLGGSIIC